MTFHDGGWDDDPHSGPRQSNRAKVVTVVVLSAIFLASIVLCCALAGEAGQLLWLRLPPP